MRVASPALSFLLLTAVVDAFTGPISIVGRRSDATKLAASSRKASAALTVEVPLTTDDNFKSSPRWRKKTKQLATLGPASSTFEMIEKLFLAGADVFRLNFSHGEHAQKKELLDIIRAVEDKYDHPIAILGDLQGPKIRTGTFANPDGEMLEAGQIFRFDSDETPGNNQRVFCLILKSLKLLKLVMNFLLMMVKLR